MAPPSRYHQVAIGGCVFHLNLTTAAVSYPIIFPNEVGAILRLRRSASYERVQLIRSLFPTSARLRARGCVLVSDFCEYEQIPPNEVNAFLTSFRQRPEPPTSNARRT